MMSTADRVARSSGCGGAQIAVASRFARWRHVFGIRITCDRANTQLRCVVRVHARTTIRMWEFVDTLSTADRVARSFPAGKMVEEPCGGEEVVSEAAAHTLVGKPFAFEM